MYFLIALLLGLLGSSLIFFADSRRVSGGEKAGAFGIFTVIYTLFGWAVIYFGMPTTAYPLFGWYSGLLLVFWTISAIVAGMMSDDWSHAGWFPILLVFILIGTSISSSSMFGSERYATLVGDIDGKTQKHWSQEVQPLDPTHIRLVPKELAMSLARTALSQDGNTLGSQFPLSESYCTLQKITTDYWYLIPLDYSGYKVWTNANFVPGYVKISATDPYQKPILVTGKKMKYTPNACFGDNLERRLYEKYYNKVLMDYSFEEDDAGNVFWVITVAKPTIAYSGLVVEGIIIFNPETGDEEFMSQKDVDSNQKYKWIDRIVPREIIEQNINYWGDLKDGWWNSAWTHLNLLEAETPTMNYSEDGRCVFVTPITSSSNNDQAMTGLMYTDARTGKSMYYTLSGGATEEAVVQAVNSAVGYKNWHGSEQIVYENVYGKLSALVPIMSANGNYQGLAIVENENKRVAIGVNPAETLVEYQKILMNSGGQISTETTKNVLEFTGKVKRIGWEISSTGKQYYLLTEKASHSFMVSSALQSELSLTKEGDDVYIRYIDSHQASVPSMEFKNLTLSLKASKNEQLVQAQMKEKKELGQTKADVKDFKEEVKSMSDDDVKKLIKKK